MTLTERIKEALNDEKHYFCLGEDVDTDVRCIHTEIIEIHDWTYLERYVYEDLATGEVMGFTWEQGYVGRITAHEVEMQLRMAYSFGGNIETIQRGEDE